MPQAFKRPLFVTLQPPFTEADLQEEQDETDEQTDCVTAVRCQI